MQQVRQFEGFSFGPNITLHEPQARAQVAGLAMQHCNTVAKAYGLDLNPAQGSDAGRALYLLAPEIATATAQPQQEHSC